MPRTLNSFALWALMLVTILTEAGALYREAAAQSQILRWEFEATVSNLHRSSMIFPDLRLGDPVRGVIGFDLTTEPDSSDPNDIFYLHPPSFENIEMVIENPREGTETTFVPDSSEPSGSRINNDSIDEMGLFDSVSVLQYVMPRVGSTGMVTIVAFELLGPPDILNDTSLPMTLHLDDWPSATISYVELSDSLDILSLVYAQVHTLTPIDSQMLPGDFNRNGIVDAADYVVWRNGLATKYTQADYDLWRSNFGKVASSGESLSAAPSVSVPEPAALSILVIAFAILGLGSSSSLGRFRV